MEKTVELNYKIVGDGQPILILHGLFGMLDNWMTYARELEDKYMVILVDLRNHGKSPHCAPHNYDVMADDVAALMDQLNITHAPVMGHSMGGKVAMRLAQKYPSRVSILLSIDMGIRAMEGGHEPLIEAMESLDLSAVGKRSDAEGQLSKSIRNKSIRLFLLKNLDRTKDGNYKWKFNLDQIKKDYAEVLVAIPEQPQYDGPTLFVGGMKSDYVSEDDLSSYRAIFPQAEVVMIPDAGHWIHVEQREALLSTVTQYIDSHI